MAGLAPDERSALRAIYESSFEPEERAPLEELVLEEQRGERRFFFAREGEAPVGFGTTRALHGGRMVECAPDYRVPKVGAEGTLSYVLVWIPLRDDAATPPAGEPLRALVTAMLVEGYGLAPSDALVGDVVDGLTS